MGDGGIGVGLGTAARLPWRPACGWPPAEASYARGCWTRVPDGGACRRWIEWLPARSPSTDAWVRTDRGFSPDGDVPAPHQSTAFGHVERRVAPPAMIFAGGEGESSPMRVHRSLAPATAVSVACAVGMTMQGSVPPALAADPSARAAYPSASPSSQVVQPAEPWIACVWDAEGVKVIRMVRPDGSDGHLAIDGAPADTEHPDRSPDGTRIAYMIGRSSIWIADADGSDPVRIATCAAPCVDIDMAAWSPDGTWLAFPHPYARGRLLHGKRGRGRRPHQRRDPNGVRAHRTPIHALASLVAGRPVDGGRARTLRVRCPGGPPRPQRRERSRSSIPGRTPRPRRRSSRRGTSRPATPTDRRQRTASCSPPMTLGRSTRPTRHRTCTQTAGSLIAGRRATWSVERRDQDSDPEIQAEKDDQEPDRASREHLESWRMGEIAGPGHRWHLRLTAHSGVSAG